MTSSTTNGQASNGQAYAQSSNGQTYAQAYSQQTPQSIPDLLGWIDFPLHTFPRIMREYVETASRSAEADHGYVAPMLIATMASAIGNLFELVVKGSGYGRDDWTESPIFWIATVGPSGSGKSPARDKAFDFIMDQQEKLDANYAKSRQIWKDNHDRWEQDKKQKIPDPGQEPEEPPRETVWVDDITSEALGEVLRDNPRGVILGPVELSTWLGSFDKYRGGGRGSDAARYLGLFDGDPWRTNRKTGTSKNVSVYKPCLNVAGPIPPNTLRNYLTEQNKQSGFIPRLLLVTPPERLRGQTDDLVDPIVRDNLDRLFQYIYDIPVPINESGSPVPYKIQLVEQARLAWTKYLANNGHDVRAAEGVQRSLLAKQPKIVARLALLFFVAKVYSGEIPYNNGILDIASMQAAIELGRWFTHETIRSLSLLERDKSQIVEASMIDWIRSRGGQVSVRDTFDCHRSQFPVASSARTCLATLESKGCGKLEKPPSGTAGGRPSEIFTLNPQ